MVWCIIKIYLKTSNSTGSLCAFGVSIIEKVRISKSKVLLLVALFLVGGIFYVSSYSIAPPKHVLAGFDIRELRQKVDIYYHIYGKLPASLNNLNEVEMFEDDLSEDYVDPWGYKYEYQTSESGFTIFSEGLHEYELMMSKAQLE